MKIILSVDAINPPLTGIGNYALQLARGLPLHSAIRDIRYFSAYRWVENPEQALSTNQPIARIRRSIPFKNTAALVYGALQRRYFHWKTRALGDYIIHAPNYVLPRCDGPAVTTIHDLSHLHYPQHHPPERIAYLAAHLPDTLARASCVIAVSDFVRQEIIELLGVPPARVITVPNGVDPVYQPYPATRTEPVLNRYGLTGTTYLLVVATLEPRKNLTRLLDAYARLPAPLQEQYPLVLAGAQGWGMDTLEQRLEPLERRGQVRRLGYVSQADLPLLYAGAWAFAYPSLYEGFGLPVLEALASGVPTLTSERSALPEVTGDAALLIDPEAVDELTTGLERLLTDTHWRSLAIERGLRQASRFSWQRCVDETVAVYQQVLTEAGMQTTAS